MTLIYIFVSSRLKKGRQASIYHPKKMVIYIWVLTVSLVIHSALELEE